jgi:acyl dehydratase
MVEKSLYFEDFTQGQQFTNGGYTVSKEQAIAFAKDFDPQYFHVDEEAAKSSIFRKLAVSGVHTAAISMRLKIDSPISKVKGGLVGLGFESLKWPMPVYPGDCLRIVITITAVRKSKSNPSNGVVSYRVETFNQDDKLVMQMETAVLVPCRQQSGENA